MEYKLHEGATIRLLMMGTHYRRKLKYSDFELDRAKKTLLKWLKVCTPCPEPHFCTVEVLECYCDDMNTAKIIFFLHKYCKEGRGEDLFKCLSFLGFFDGNCKVTETKTLPERYASGFGPDIRR